MGHIVNTEVLDCMDEWYGAKKFKIRVVYPTRQLINYTEQHFYNEVRGGISLEKLTQK
jgi:hypothetical protein